MVQKGQCLNTGRTHFKKGMTPWNKGKHPECLQKENHPMFGKHHTEEAKKKMSIAHKGQISWNKGKKLTDEQKDKLNITGLKLGHGWNKGTKGIMKAWNKGKKQPEFSGENHPNWKGGKVSKDKIERIRFQKTVQKKVFERDNYTCQICGIRGNQTGGQLQVDHIQSWAEYVELRFNIENCRTLCMKCHYQITFGKPMPPEVRAWGHNLSKGGKYL